MESMDLREAGIDRGALCRAASPVLRSPLALALVAAMALFGAPRAALAQDPVEEIPVEENSVQEVPAEQEPDAPLLDLDALAPAGPGAGLRADLQAETLQGLPAGMAAMILGGGEGGQVTLVPLAIPVLMPTGTKPAPPTGDAPGDMADAEAPRAAVALLVEIDGPSLFGPSPAPETEVQFFAYALTPEDAVAGFLSQRVELDLTEVGEAAFAGGLKLVGHLELPPGDYSVRVLVHEPSSQRFGLAVLPVSVPRRAALLTPLREESPEAPWLMVAEAPHGEMGALDLGRVLELAGTPMPSALPLLRGREVPMDLLLYGAAGSRLPRQVEVRADGDPPPGPLMARVISRQASRLPGLERLRLGVPIESLASGSYRLSFHLDSLNGAPATSPELPVVVLQGEDTANLWTDIQRRISGDAMVSLDMSEVNRRRRGRQERARQAVASAYSQVLGRLADGERDAALDNLIQVEREVLASGQEKPMALLTESEALVLEALAEADPQALLPVMMLHGRAYDRYLGNLELGLSTYSREKAIAIIELYVRRVEDRWRSRLSERGVSTAVKERAEEEIAAARSIASDTLTSFGAYLQSVQVRMAGRALLRRALEIEPDNPAALLQLGAGLEKTGSYDEAVNVLRRLVEVDPKSPEGRLRLAVNLRRLGREGQAMELLSSLIREDNPDWVLAVAYQELASLHLSRDQASQAVTLLDQGVGRLPDQERLRIQLAYALDRTGDGARARQVVVRMEPRGSGPRVVVVDGDGEEAAVAPDAGPPGGGPAAASDAAAAPTLLTSAVEGGDGDYSASPRHRYNRWPRDDLTGSDNTLAQAAMARLTSLRGALAELPNAEQLEDLDQRRREGR